ncbi:hypothetical protein TNCV_1553351 [Trichonephila clavipes]|nr:hypothetical protein TNCV_1553351 [Trichonephila clavipes]
MWPAGHRLSIAVLVRPIVFNGREFWVINEENEEKLIIFEKKNLKKMFGAPYGWRGWFVARLLNPRLRVRPRPKSAGLPDAENRRQPFRMIIRHVKDPLSVRLASVLAAKLNPCTGSHR